jgi:hypothetical protein
VERHYALKLDLEETMDETIAIAHLSLWGDTFEARGKAMRNPSDPSIPVIGEELAIARSLAELSAQMLEAAQAKISKHAASTG